MLSLLHIENIALIESADINFGAGFNVLTGETGAGKSIIIDSISAVLGERTSRDLIRTGAKNAYVSAIFIDLPDLEWFHSAGIEPNKNGELLLEREIQADGRNVCRINSRPHTVTQLRELGQQLLNIHGQHDGQQLLNEECHLNYLDRFGALEILLVPYQTAYRAFCSTQREINALQMDDAEKSRHMDLLAYQIHELEQAKLKQGEDIELNEKKNVFRSAGKMISSLDLTEYALDGSGEQEGAISQLASAADALVQAARCCDAESKQGKTLSNLAEQLNQMRYDAYDALEVCRDIKAELDVSPDEIDRMESRLDLLYRLGKKYGSSVDEMLAFLEKCRSELDRIQCATDRIAQLEKKLAQQRTEVEKQARLLTEARKRAASQLQMRIQQELADLDMPKVRFEVRITPKENEIGMDSTGMDQVRFLMSANIGEDLKPINKIASGGELARIMLALKSVLAESDDVTTMIFDEVDTGVSGRAATKVARKMAQVARQKQILCVTHLPQIAAMADIHFFVEKKERAERTYTSISRLSEDGRAAEIARLTAGEKITKTALNSAKELLKECKELKQTFESVDD